MALSAIHDLAGPQLTRAAPSAPATPQVADSGTFVIPSFAPSTPVEAPVQMAALDASAERDTPLVLTPISTYADPEAQAPTVSDDLLPPRTVVAPTKPATKPQAVARRAPVMTAHVESFQPSSRAKARPVIVAQVPFSGGLSGAESPDYLIGVYR